MFEEFHGLPVHALAVHATVVLVPLSALLAVLFAIPRFRRWATYVFPLVTVAATASVFVSRQSGQNLEKALGITGGNDVGDLIVKHYDAARVLWLAMLGFTVLAVVAYALTRVDGLLDGPVGIVVSVVLVLSAGFVAYQTYKTGELGAKAVWNPTGDSSFTN